MSDEPKILPGPPVPLSAWSTESWVCSDELDRIRPQLDELERWFDTLPEWAQPVSFTVRIEGRIWQRTRLAVPPGSGKA